MLSTPSLLLRLLHRGAITGLGLLLVAATSQAQTTHTVNLAGASFSPANLTVQLGDTVQWNWVTGLHNVESGVGGAPDGNFSSGAPVNGTGVLYSVTFDQPFLAANPMPGNNYPYYCIIHLGFGMIGQIDVHVPGQLNPYGCIATAGTLTHISGLPEIGNPITFGVDNPFGTQPAGSLAFLLISLQPSFGFPCGIPLPGWGMQGPAFSGELLVDISPLNLIMPLAGPNIWAGAGTPSPFPLSLPPNPKLVGIALHLQGLIADPTLSSSVVTGLTDAIQMQIGG